MKTREKVAISGMLIGLSIAAYFILIDYTIFIEGEDCSYFKCDTLTVSK